MKVYLAGNMVTDWRRPIIEANPDIEWIEPARGDDWFESQCEQMSKAGACLAYIDMEARHIGTVSELSAFRVMNKPRILVIHPERLSDRGYTLAAKLVSNGMVTTDMEQGIEWLRQLVKGR